jgi:hypothetical protein
MSAKRSGKPLFPQLSSQQPAQQPSQHPNQQAAPVTGAVTIDVLDIHVLLLLRE